MQKLVHTTYTCTCVWFVHHVKMNINQLCPLYASLRCKYVPDMYVNDVSEASYNVRLKSSDNKTTVKNLAIFVLGALKERDSLLDRNNVYTF